MTTFILSLDEIDRVKRLNGWKSRHEMVEKMNLCYKTWQNTLRTLQPTSKVLTELAKLGARPDKILVLHKEEKN